MSLRNRIKTGLSFIFSGKSISELTPIWRTEPTFPEVRYENAVNDGYKKNELIFSCINKTAVTSSQVHLKVVNPLGKTIEQHGLTDLLAAPNPFMNESDFWGAITVFQKLAGWAVFEKEYNNGGEVIGLHALRPDWVMPIHAEIQGQPTIRGRLTHYVYKVPGITPIPLRIQDLVIFRLFDPLKRFVGFPPVVVASRVGDIDNSQTDFLKLFFEGGGVPYGYIKTKQKLNDPAAEEIRTRWKNTYGGFRKWNKPMVLDRDADYVKMGLDFREMGFEVLDARSEARICMIFDVPPIIVGAKIGLDRATYANYGEARSAWWEDTLVPMYKNHLDALEQQLLPDFDDNASLEWDVSKVPALQENMDKRWERANGAFRSGAITRNQFLVEIGQEEIGVAGEVYYVPFNVVPTPAKMDPALQRVDALDSGDEPEMEMDIEADEQDIEDDIKRLELELIETKRLQDAPDDARRRKDQKKLSKDLDVYFARLERRIEKGLKANAVEPPKTKKKSVKATKKTTTKKG